MGYECNRKAFNELAVKVALGELKYNPKTKEFDSVKKSKDVDE